MICGTVTIKRGKNQSAAGKMPSIVYEDIAKLYYTEKTVGVKRYWDAKEHSAQADLLIEVAPMAANPATDRAFVEPFNSGAEKGLYKVIQAQQVTTDDGLPATDLTLELMEAFDVDDTD